MEENGGSQPVLDTSIIYLECNSPPTFGGFGTPQIIAYDTIYDSTGSPLGAIPAAMGLALSQNANPDDQITVTDAQGRWHFELMLNTRKDATAFVDVALHSPGDYTGGPRLVQQVANTFISSGEFCMNTLGTLVAGNVVYVDAATLDTPAPTDNAYVATNYAVLKVTRLQ